MLSCVERVEVLAAVALLLLRLLGALVGRRRRRRRRRRREGRQRRQRRRRRRRARRLGDAKARRLGQRREFCGRRRGRRRGRRARAHLAGTTSSGGSGGHGDGPASTATGCAARAAPSSMVARRERGVREQPLPEVLARCLVPSLAQAAGRGGLEGSGALRRRGGEGCAGAEHIAWVRYRERGERSAVWRARGAERRPQESNTFLLRLRGSRG